MTDLAKTEEAGACVDTRQFTGDDNTEIADTVRWLYAGAREEPEQRNSVKLL